MPEEPPEGDTVEMDEICICFSPGFWLWLSVSRTLGVVLAFVLGDRSDAMLKRLWHEEMPYAWRELPVCTDAWGAYGRVLPPELHEICDKGSGKTSKVEALNTKSSNCAHLLRRQRQSGLVRKSCGVWEGICDDISERFLILLDRHNQQCLKPPRKYQKSKLPETQLSP